MARKKRKAPNRIYRKDGRYYGDFRRLGGKCEALKPPGEARATTDEDVARVLYADRVKELEGIRRGEQILGRGHVATLASYAAHHLKQKRIHNEATDWTLGGVQRSLERAIAFFCNGGKELPRDEDTGDAILTGIRDRALPSIDVPDVMAWAAWLRQNYGGRRGNTTLSDGAVRHALNALGNLYVRAIREHKTTGVSHNPVAEWGRTRPKGKPKEARFLEVHEAALLLEACKLYKPEREDVAIPDLHALVATHLLTGGRPAEVRGLAIDDVSFERKKITFREHPWRRLKTLTSARVVTLWPQLEEILRAYLDGPNAPKGKLLFPSRHRRVRGHEDEEMIGDIRKALDSVAAKVGWAPGEIRSYAFRHTYCATRLQTLDNGEPVSPYTVGRELGHGGAKLVDKVYAHLGNVRHRSEVVEYRPAVLTQISDAKERERFEKRFKEVERHLQLVA